MIITEITLDVQKVIPGDPTRFRVGMPVVEGGHVVEKIVYHPDYDRFNGGGEIGFACYAVFFSGIPERRLIATKIVTTLEAVTIKVNKSEGAGINLPG